MFDFDSKGACKSQILCNSEWKYFLWPSFSMRNETACQMCDCTSLEQRPADSKNRKINPSSPNKWASCICGFKIISLKKQKPGPGGRQSSMPAQHQVNKEPAGHVHTWKHGALGHHTWDWQCEFLGVLRLFKYFLSAWLWARKLFLFLAYKMKETLKNMPVTSFLGFFWYSLYGQLEPSKRQFCNC